MIEFSQTPLNLTEGFPWYQRWTYSLAIWVNGFIPLFEKLHMDLIARAVNRQ